MLFASEIYNQSMCAALLPAAAARGCGLFYGSSFSGLATRRASVVREFRGAISSGNRGVPLFPKAVLFHGMEKFSMPNPLTAIFSSDSSWKVLLIMLFWSTRAKDNKSLVGILKTSGVIKSQRVADVMEQLDRGLFVQDGMAYMDSPMPIGYNATISAPHMHASCLELLKDHLKPGMHALDIGAGTGYLTAAFALLVGEKGKAVGVEHIPELQEQAVENVNRSKAAALLASGALSVHVGDGRKGWPEHAPYDAIHVGAAAAKVPQPLIDQLKPGGRLVIPVGEGAQSLVVIDKQLDGSLRDWVASSVRYVPLTSKESQLMGE